MLIFFYSLNFRLNRSAIKMFINFQLLSKKFINISWKNRQLVVLVNTKLAVTRHNNRHVRFFFFFFDFKQFCTTKRR